MSHTDSATCRIPFGLFRGGRLKPDTEPDRSAVIWAELTAENFMEACDEHLDDILREIDQMFSDFVTHITDIANDGYEDRDAWADAARKRFPWVPVERQSFATPDEYVRLLRSASPPWLNGEPDYSDAVRFKFAGWRDLSVEEFQALALEWMSLLFDDHEALRARLCVCVAHTQDRLGWSFYGPRRVAEDLMHQLFYRWPTTPQEDY